MTHQTQEYVHGDFVFRLQATANGYGSYVDVYTRRHFDNCLANGTEPWAILGIKVKADNGEFVAFEPSQFAQFVDFCEMWITNPHETMNKVRAEIAESERDARIQRVHEFYPPKVKQLDDFPYVGYDS